MVKIWELGVGLKLENGSLDQLTRDIQQKLEQSWEVAGEKAWKWIKKWLDQKQATSELARDIEQKVWNAGEKAGNKLQQSIWWGLKALVGLGVAKALNTAAGWAYTLAGNLEQADVAFTTMLWGADAARKMLQDLSDFAANTPFELTGVRQTAKQLLAYGIEANKIIPTLKALGDVSAGLSVPIEQVAYAYGQVRSATKLTWNDLKQFINAGVPIIWELAKNLWVSESKIKDMVSAGKIWFADVEKAFQTMSSEWGKFANLMEAQSNTMMGARSNLQDAVDSLWEAIWSLFTGEVGGLFKRMSSIVDTVKDWAVAHPALTKALVTFVGVAGGLVGVLTALSGAVAVVGIAFWAATLPILAAVGAVAALTAGTVLLTTAIKDQNEFRRHQGKGFSELKKEIEQNKKATEELHQAYNEWKITAAEYQEKLRKLKEENGSLQKAQNKTAMSYDDIKSAINEVNNSKLDNREKLQRLLEIQQRAVFTQKSIIELKKELASLSKSVNNIQELESWKLSLGSFKAHMIKQRKDTWSWMWTESGDQRSQRMKDEQAILQDQVDHYDELAESAISLQKQIDDLNKTIENWGGGGGDWSSWASKKAEKLKEVMDKLKKSYDEAQKADKDYEAAAKKTAEDVRKYYEKLWDEILGLKKKYQDLIKEFEKDQQSDKENFLRSQTEKVKELKDNISKGKSELIDLKKDAHAKKDQKLGRVEIEDIFKENNLANAKKQLEDIKKQLETTSYQPDREKLKAKQEYLTKVAEQLQLEESLQTVEKSTTGLRKKQKEELEEAKKKLEDYKSSMADLKKKINEGGGKDMGFDFIFDITDKKEANELLKYAKEQLWKQMSIEDEARLKLKIEIIEKVKEQLDLEEQLKKATEANDKINQKVEDEKKRAEMTPEERAIYDFEQQQKKKEEEFNEKKNQIEKEMKIYEFFQNAKFKSSAEVGTLISEENLKNYSIEERELILKLARERIQLEQQKEAKIRLEEDLHKKINQLSNDTTSLQLTNLGKLKTEYKTLISQIDAAISKQRQLNSIKSSWGFSAWGFTGLGANDEVAGVVHKNERVAPAWMTSQFSGVFKSLENIRTRGFQEWGFTTDNSRHIEQNNTINVQNVFDMEEFLERQRRKLR